MKDGVVQQVDTPQNLYNTPCNLFVAGFIGSPQMNFMDAVVDIKGNDVTLTVGKHTLKVPASKKSGTDRRWIQRKNCCSWYSSGRCT